MKKNNESETMENLHKIREAHYEATEKDSIQNVLSEIRKQSEKIMKKYMLDLPVLAKSTT